MATKIGLSGSEATVRDPNVPEGPTYLTVGGSRRALDGSRIRHVVATKRSWELAWTLLTADEKAALMTELLRDANLVFYPPEGGNYTVQVVEGSLSCQYEVTDTWSVRVTLEQV